MITLMTEQEASRRLLSARIRAIYEASGNTYGSPRVHDALRDMGVRVGKKAVETIMKEGNMQGSHVRKQHSTPIEYPPNMLLFPDEVTPHVMRRCFDVQKLTGAHGIDRVWTSDMTQFLTPDGWLYLAAMIDLYSRRIIGWAMSEAPNTRLTLAALAMAMTEREPKRGIIVHNDRGVQYSSADYRKALRAYGARQSTSATGSCLDNAPMESCFSTIKRETNLTDLSRAETRAELEHYIRHYNETRKHSALGNVSPAAFEAMRRKR